MAGHGLRRTSALRVAVTVAIGAGAIGAGEAVGAGAGGLRGSPAAVRVARQVLSHARHVVALRWRQGGDQWECPSPDGPIVGPSVKRPGRSCRRATVTFEENLRNGRIVRSMDTANAGGLATQTELVSGAGDWLRTGRARCWDAQGAGVINTSAFSYTGERLSITARNADVIMLRGVGQGFRESDAIDAHTFAVREVDERVPGFGGTATLVARFTELTRPLALPIRPRRVCSDIVRFPPQPRARSWRASRPVSAASGH
jgi:hypothetical protein